MFNFMFFTFFLLILSNLALAKPAARLDYPYYVVQSSKDGLINKMQMLHTGAAAMAKRIEIIRKAKKSIEAEYFIWNDDTSGKILLQELVSAAKRGVKVRVLLDKSFAVLKIGEFYHKALAEKGVEVRYYNPAPLYQVSTIQFRTHRKHLSIDDTEVITGGRNIGDEYFDYDPEYNYLDRDIWVSGPIVKPMVEVFNNFWAHGITESPDQIEFEYINPSKKPFRQKWQNDNKLSVMEARYFLSENKEDKKIKEMFLSVGMKQLEKEPIEVCPTTTFGSDKPGAVFHERIQSNYEKNYRVFREVISKHLLAAQKTVFISSPYIMHNMSKSRQILDLLSERGIEVSIYTNSLNSTDAVYVAANFYSRLDGFVERGVKVYVHDSKFLEGHAPVIDPRAEKTRWGTHAKTMIFDDSTFMISTYNIDNRSSYYNTEMGIFCAGSDKLMKSLIDDREKNIEGAIFITGPDEAIDSKGNPADYHGGASDNYRRIMEMVTHPSRWAEFLM